MKKLSKFDLGVIIAFVVIALLGGGAWWYLSGQLQTAQADATAANADFLKYSQKQPFLPTTGNEKVLKENLDLVQAQLDPIIKQKLLATDNKLSEVPKKDTVAWKHDLDAEVSRLNSAAKAHGVTVPNNFYFGFSKYLNQNPSDEQTVVLGKQMLGVEQIANIFINAPVKSIATFRRTYEEDAGSGGARSDPDVLPGAAESAAGGIYTAYPFEIEFDTGTESLRRIINGLQSSPYIFVIRSLTIANSNPASPQISDLQKFAGPPSGGVLESAPGSVASTKSSRGPQFLFGNETLHVKIRLDMIEWKGGK